MKFLRVLMGVSVSVVIALFYGIIFENIFGSPKEKLLEQQIDNYKLKYSLVQRELNNKAAALNSFRLSDDRRYRPILDMDCVPESYRQAGAGGVDKFNDLNGYTNSNLIISCRSKIEEIIRKATIQKESFESIKKMSAEWRYEIDHQPAISPVNVKYGISDGFRFRKVHPVLGVPRMHYGLDFHVPYGTNVYATGDGKVIESGWDSGGFGNCVVIDHGFGLQTTYGHLSKMKVPVGENVKRGDIIGLSGSTGISSGPHLHYQIDQFGQHKNPMNFFSNDITTEEFNEMIQTFESRSKL